MGRRRTDLAICHRRLRIAAGPQLGQQQRRDGGKVVPLREGCKHLLQRLQGRRFVGCLLAACASGMQHHISIASACCSYCCIRPSPHVWGSRNQAAVCFNQTLYLRLRRGRRPQLQTGKHQTRRGRPPPRRPGSPARLLCPPTAARAAPPVCMGMHNHITVELVFQGCCCTAHTCSAAANAPACGATASGAAVAAAAAAAAQQALRPHCWLSSPAAQDSRSMTQLLALTYANPCDCM